MINNWIETYSGKKFYPLNPTLDQIELEDIAHALSIICRYGGHCSSFYSVGQHSINVYKALKDDGYNVKMQLYGLLHDASEAYICDIPRPIKPLINNYKYIEEKVQNIIWKKFNLSLPNEEELKIIKDYDSMILASEAKYLMKNYKDWNLPESNFKIDNFSTSSNKIKYEFINLVNYLLQTN